MPPAVRAGPVPAPPPAAAARAPELARGPTGSIGARRGARPIRVGFPSASACGRSARGRAVASERLGSGERRVHATPGATRRAASSARAVACASRGVGDRNGPSRAASIVPPRRARLERLERRNRRNRRNRLRDGFDERNARGRGRIVPCRSVRAASEARRAKGVPDTARDTRVKRTPRGAAPGRRTATAVGDGVSRGTGDDGGTNGTNGRSSTPLFPGTIGGFFRSVGIGLTVAFGGLVFAVSFATLVFDGPEGSRAPSPRARPSCCSAARRRRRWWRRARVCPPSPRCRTAPAPSSPSWRRRFTAPKASTRPPSSRRWRRRSYAEGVSTGAIMSLLGKYKLGNIVRLLPSPVTGGFLAGTGYVLTAGALKVLSGSSDDGAEIDTFVTFVRTMIANVDDTDRSSRSSIHPPDGSNAASSSSRRASHSRLALAVGNRRVRKFWVVPAFLGGGVAAYFSALRVFLNLSPDARR